MGMVSENSFESGVRKVIPAVLVYLRQNGKVLMIHRIGRKDGKVDHHLGRWNGLGGKFEADESPLEAARREIQEEAGITVEESQFQILGVLQFPNFKAHKSEDWLVYVLTADLSEKVTRKETQEGTLEWVSEGDVMKLNLWPGDRHFIPFVLERKAFVGTLWYEGSEVKRHWVRTFS